MRNILFIIIFIEILSSIISPFSFASNSVHKANMINLSNNAIICMHQDADGYLWFGSYDGLNLYNGKNTYVYRFELNNEKSLCSNIITKITDAEPGYLWVTTSLGINKFSLKERTVTESFPGYKECEFLASDKTGKTLAITKENTISCYTPNSDGFRDIPTNGISPKNMKELVVSAKNQFYLFLSSGFYKKITPEISKNTFALPSEEYKYHDLPVTAAFHEQDHLFFVDSREQLFSLNMDYQQKKHLADLSGQTKRHGHIVKIFTYQSSTYVLFRDGVLLNTCQNQKSMNIGADVFSLIKDKRQDILWLGTDGQGVKMIYEKPNLFGSFLYDELPINIQNPIRAIYTDEDHSLWFGTKGSGIVRIQEYDRYVNNKLPQQTISHYTTENGLPSNRIYFFKRSAFYPIVWIGTEGLGLTYYSYSDSKFHTLQQPEGNHPIQYVHAIAEVNDSTLWLATTGNGLQKVSLRTIAGRPSILSTQNFLLKKEKNVCNEIQCLIYDNDSTLFLGSRGGYGIIRFNVFDHSYNFWQMNNKENLAIGDVLSICFTKDSTFYIGASSGLSRIKFEKNQMLLRQFYADNGMSNDMIHGILPGNDGCIWLSTNKGLTKYSPQNDFFHNYLQPNINVTEFSDDAYWECPYTGRLFFGGINGLVWINKESTSRKTFQPALNFFTIKMDDKVLPLNKEICKKGVTVPSHVQTLRISFTTADYIDGENYEYAYQLENYNSSWISLGNDNNINFVKLPYGSYNLKVRYHNDVTDSIAKEYTLPITILPPFYLSSKAIVCYILLGIALMISIICIVYFQLKRKKKQITQRIKEEQKEKLYEAKLNFFTHITHELCTPLTLINGVEHYISTFAKTTDNKSLSKYTSVLQTNVTELNELIQEILDFRKAEDSGFNHVNIQNVAISSIVQAQTERFIPLAEQQSIQFLVESPQKLTWHTDPVFIKKILSNLISNAFKYTKKEGTIRVSVIEQNDQLIIKVYNTGKGIRKEELGTIFDRYRILGSMENNERANSTVRNGLGLFICHNLVNSLGGKITVNSEEGKYAEFQVSLPASKINLKETVETNERSFLNEEVTHDLSEEKERFPKEIVEQNNQPNILVVDDHKDIVWLITETLGKNYHVQKAYSAEEALEYLKDHTPSLLITDIILPKMSGLELISSIKKDKYTSHIPVIIASAKISEKEQAEGLNIGADAYLTKPFSPTVLKSLVNRLVTNQKDLKDYFNSPESAFQITEGQLLHQEDKEFMDTITTIIKENIGKEGLGPEFIAEMLHINTRTLYRRFKKISSNTPSEYIKDYRLSHAAKLLINTNLNVQEIIYSIGISNKSYFYREFARKFNMTPKEYRTKGMKKS